MRSAILLSILLLAALISAESQRERKAEKHKIVRDSFPSVTPKATVTVKVAGGKKAPPPSVDEDEDVLVKVDALENGDIDMTFSHHGQDRKLHLKDSKMDVDDIPYILVGKDKEAANAAKAKFKEQKIKIMRDPTFLASVAVRLGDDPTIEGGVYSIGLDEFSMDTHEGNTMKVRKRSIKDSEYTNAILQVESKVERKKRQTSGSTGPVIATVELLPFVDFSVYHSYSTDSSIGDPDFSILLYFAHLVNMMDVTYSNIRNADLQISIKMAGLYVYADFWDNRDLIEDHTFTKAEDGWYGPDCINGEETLRRLEAWLASASSDDLPPNDHVMLFTTYDLVHNDDSSSLVGIGFTNSMCNPSYSSSFVEMKGIHTFVAHTGVRQLGNSLGGIPNSEYGSGTECPSDLMTSYGLQYDQFLFSCCTQKYLYRAIKDKQCVFDDTATDGDMVLVPEFIFYLPGELFSADDQCYRAHGTGHCDPSIYQQQNVSMCRQMYCYNPDDMSTCSAWQTGAADGTPCDDSEKMCYQGACLDGPSIAHLPQQTCDVNGCFSGEKPCGQGNYNLLEPQMNQCYRAEHQCDGKVECSNDRDEANCGGGKCVDMPWFKRKCRHVKLTCKRAVRWNSRRLARNCKISCTRHYKHCCETCRKFYWGWKSPY